MEIWKTIPGTNGHYEASSLGNIRSVARDIEVVRSSGLPYVRHCPSRVLKTHPLPKGYLSLRLGGDSQQRTVHQLVLEAFVGPRPDGAECRHLDGDPSNNRLENLAWGTREENRADQIRHGRKVGRRPGEGRSVCYPFEDPQCGDWYRRYPRHKAPGDAEKAWRKLKPEARAQALKVVDAFKAECLRKISDGWDPGWIPYPATYLNAGSYWDEPDPVAPPPPPSDFR